ADVIVVSCPLCAFNLDERQRDLMRLHSGFKAIPVLYFTQVMAVAFGLDPETLGLEYNWVDPKPVIQRYFLKERDVLAENQKRRTERL
ncbi:MAG: hypothetical protein ACTSW4_00630, partial [Candidatus Ranarchaeia archaeon]